MNIAIIQFPGSNCERETMLAVQRAQMQPVPFLWNEPGEKLEACDGCVIVGGFAYEDRGRAGIIASLDPIMQTVRQLAMQGKPVLGICNGAQILVESGLVPGIVGNKVGMALAMNRRIKNQHVLGVGYYNDWIYVKLAKPYPNNAFLRHLNPEQPICIPTAHGEGRFILAPGLLKKLQSKNIAMMQYCNADSCVKNEFPTNPNGSEYNLAAVCNRAGNVIAIMPHPERTTNGDVIFNSMRDYIAEQKSVHVQPLFFALPKVELLSYQPVENTFELIVELIITDNTAVSIQKALQSLNLDVKIRRQTHWEIKYKDQPQQLKTELIKSFELFNPNKEQLISEQNTPQANTFSILVRNKDDLIGQHKCEVLRKSFGIENIVEVKQGILWHITVPKRTDMHGTIDAIIDKHILFNPYAHEGYVYSAPH